MSATTTASPAAPTAPEEPQAPARSSRGSILATASFAAVSTIIAVLGAAAALHGVISGWAWMLQISVVVIGIVLATNLTRALGARRYLSTVAGALAAVLGLTVLFFSNTAFLGVLPTGATYRALLQVWALANEEMGSQVPPVQSTGVIVFSVCLWAAVVALAVDILAFELRAAALAGLPLAMLLVIASLFEANGAGLAAVAVTAVGYLLLLAASRFPPASSRGAPRRAVEVAGSGQGPDSGTLAARRPSGAVVQSAALMAGALAALLVLPAAIPGFSKGMLTEGTRPSWGQLATNIDPMIALGNDLRSRASGTVLHYFTDSRTPTYLRTSVIGDLTANRWEPDPDAYRVPATESLPTLSFPTVNESAEPVFTRVVTDKYRGQWMPLPAHAATLNGVGTGWGWNPETGTLRAAEGQRPTAEDYTVMSVNPHITEGTLDSLGSRLPQGFFGEVESVYLDLPEDTPGSLAKATDKAVDGVEEDPYRQAVAIQDYLRSTEFSYSESTPVQDGYDGSGMSVIDAFLKEKAGYCIHFASTMALMARDLGIPSRLVTGYSPGTATGVSITGQDGAELKEYEVNSRNAHAWPELYFAGAGWVGFEPTPGRGVPPVYAPALPAPSASAAEDPRLENPTNSASESSAAESSSSAGSSAAGNGPESGPPVAEAMRVLLMVVLAGAVPWVLRRFQRASRFSRLRRDTDTEALQGKETGAGAAWAELVALGLDYALPMRQDESAGDYARRLGRTLGRTGDAVALLAGAYERMRYAPGQPASTEPEALEAALGEVKHELTARLGFGARLGRTLWPRSVFAPRPLAEISYGAGNGST